jgi:hypothetical protein
MRNIYRAILWIRIHTPDRKNLILALPNDLLGFTVIAAFNYATFFIKLTRKPNLYPLYESFFNRVYASGINIPGSGPRRSAKFGDIPIERLIMSGYEIEKTACWCAGRTNSF